MNRPNADARFSGSIPSLYQELLVPMLFQPYAMDLVARVVLRPCARVLELAAGTGAVTRHLAALLPPSSTLVATDLNQAMLDLAITCGTARSVTWRQADAMALPFDDGAFDAVVCQFGVMFFPDKAKAFAEMRRVLVPGGTLYFNVWDRIEENEFAHTVSTTVAAAFPADPPQFMARTPHGYAEPAAIRRDLLAGGFTTEPRVDTVPLRSHAPTPRVVAMAFCQGTPLRAEIEARDADRLEAVTALAEAALARRFGAGPLDGRMQGHVVVVVGG